MYHRQDDLDPKERNLSEERPLSRANRILVLQSNTPKKLKGIEIGGYRGVVAVRHNNTMRIIWQIADTASDADQTDLMTYNGLMVSIADGNGAGQTPREFGE